LDPVPYSTIVLGDGSYNEIILTLKEGIIVIAGVRIIFKKVEKSSLLSNISLR